MQFFEKYLPYWPVIAASVLFLALGLWWRLSAARAMERTPKSADWVKHYRSGAFPFRQELLGNPNFRWWALLLTMVLAAGFAVIRLVNTGMIYLQRPDIFFHSKYGIFQLLLCAVGAGAVYILLTLLFGSLWTALPGALLFAASSARGHADCCFLAVSLLLLLLYLRAEKPGFPAELLYLGSILVLAPLLALRQPLVWLLLFYPPVHWYKLVFQRRAGTLSGWQLFWSLLAALAAWAAMFVGAAVLRRYLLLGFRRRELALILEPQRIRYACSELLKQIRLNFFKRPTPGMTIDLMVDAPLFGLGFWGCASAWILARKRRSARGVFALVVLGALLLTWLISGRYALTLGLVLTAACVLRDADLAKKRIPVVLLSLAGICWYVCIQIAAWYFPLVPGLVERLV